MQQGRPERPQHRPELEHLPVGQSHPAELAVQRGTQPSPPDVRSQIVFELAQGMPSVVHPARQMGPNGVSAQPASAPQPPGEHSPEQKPIEPVVVRQVGRPPSAIAAQSPSHEQVRQLG